ncbi:uncharacterized protein LOC124376517 [Silurus meridionalis]|uniref:uncharacterized protein LOC124376517 n=1 Tax=Silurus meridionalis TaxID=175797 RepID=UPI001EEA2E8C|nr:uncharacterized protein LOC124376517 [Silurus meridionalis]
MLAVYLGMLYDAASICKDRCFPQTTRTVSRNIQGLLNQLRASSARMARANTSTPNQASVESVPNTTAQDMRFAAVGALQRPVPRPRVRAQAPNPVSIQAPNPVSIQAPNPVSIQAPNPVSIQAPNPVSIQANPSAPSYLSLNDIYDMNLQPHIPVMDNSGNILRTYNCPYCQEGGLDDLDLRDHCNEHHINDRRQVVCPVCVSLPHGNPTYCSRDLLAILTSATATTSMT